jgi:hypothetical protein
MRASVWACRQKAAELAAAEGAERERDLVLMRAVQEKERREEAAERARKEAQRANQRQYRRAAWPLSTEIPPPRGQNVGHGACRISPICCTCTQESAPIPVEEHPLHHASIQGMQGGRKERQLPDTISRSTQAGMTLVQGGPGEEHAEGCARGSGA